MQASVGEHVGIRVRGDNDIQRLSLCGSRKLKQTGKYMDMRWY